MVTFCQKSDITNPFEAVVPPAPQGSPRRYLWNRTGI